MKRFICNVLCVTGRPCGPITQWSEYSHSLRGVLCSSPVPAVCFFLPCDIWWPVWVCAQAASSKGTVSSVLAWFWPDSGMNLIKQGEIDTGQPCGLVAQWSECSHSMQEVLGSSRGRAMCFFLLCDMWIRNTLYFLNMFFTDLHIFVFLIPKRLSWILSAFVLYIPCGLLFSCFHVQWSSCCSSPSVRAADLISYRCNCWGLKMIRTGCHILTVQWVYCNFP